MKRFIICALVAFSISCVAACCGFSEVEADMENIFVSVDYDRFSEIVYHKKTKVMYIRNEMYAGYSYTLLVNPDGTPMVWEG